MTTLTLEVSETTEATYFYFTVKLSEKTQYFISLQGKELFIQKLSHTGRLIAGGTWFTSLDSAVSHYKNAKMKSALNFIPDYISQGLTGTQSV